MEMISLLEKMSLKYLMLHIKNIKLGLFGQIFTCMIREQQLCLVSLHNIAKMKRKWIAIEFLHKDFHIWEASDANYFLKLTKIFIL